MAKINFKITTPEHTVYEAEVDSATIPTQMGEITVLPEHIPIISLLKAGELIVRKEKEEESIAVSGGFIEVGHNKIVILADSAERAEEIDVDKVEEARRQAEKVLKEKSENRGDYAAITASLEREMARLKVGKKYRRLKGIRTGKG